MAEYDFIKMEKKLAKYLDEDRYAHTMGVMYTCAALAMVHGCDLTPVSYTHLWESMFSRRSLTIMTARFTVWCARANMNHRKNE